MCIFHVYLNQLEGTNYDYSLFVSCNGVWWDFGGSNQYTRFKFTQQNVQQQSTNVFCWYLLFTK